MRFCKISGILLEIMADGANWLDWYQRGCQRKFVENWYFYWVPLATCSTLFRCAMRDVGWTEHLKQVRQQVDM